MAGYAGYPHEQLKALGTKFMAAIVAVVDLAREDAIDTKLFDAAISYAMLHGLAAYVVGDAVDAADAELRVDRLAAELRRMVADGRAGG